MRSWWCFFHHIKLWPRDSGLGKVWPVGISLSHRAPATPVAGRAQCTQGLQVHGVSSDTLVRLASGLDALCVKKQCCLVGLCFGGRMASTFVSPEPVREL
jgi:hypothetical protein